MRLKVNYKALSESDFRGSDDKVTKWFTSQPGASHSKPPCTLPLKPTNWSLHSVPSSQERKYKKEKQNKEERKKEICIWREIKDELISSRCLNAEQLKIIVSSINVRKWSECSIR